ncbi:MAG TPA: hypothetical protein VLL48_01075, partial [Longimicrobiales bacterium]|nr:hypothetical protein [Longimicrobiales bacterium]
AAFELPPVRGADPTNDEARFELPRVGEAEAAARGSRDPRDPGPAEKWDPAHLARRAPRSRKRKPGRAAAVILVVALAVLVLLMTVLLP